MKQEWKVVATFNQLAQAQVAKTLLQSEGIECVIADEQAQALNIVIAPSMGGIRLLTKPEDYADAIKLLNQTN